MTAAPSTAVSKTSTTVDKSEGNADVVKVRPKSWGWSVS
jgi:hypothetical protein